MIRGNGYGKHARGCSTVGMLARYSRDFVELVNTVIDVLEIGIDVGPSLAGRTKGRAVVGRRGLK